MADDLVAVPSPEGPIQVRQMRLDEGKRSWIVAYWFAVGRERTANPVTAKLMEVRTIINGEHKKPALIAVALETKGLDQPGASLNAIVGEVAAPMAGCLIAEPGSASWCRALGP